MSLRLVAEKRAVCGVMTCSEGCGVCRGVPQKRLAQRERMEEEDEGCGVGRGVPHKRLAQSESGVDGGDDVVAVWV